MNLFEKCPSRNDYLNLDGDDRNVPAECFASYRELTTATEQGAFFSTYST